MKNTKPCLFFILIVTVLSTSSSFYKKDNKKIKALSGREISVDEIDRFLKIQMDSLNVKGISIAVVNDAKVVYHRAFGIAGIADASSLNMVNDQTLFQAASVSKPIFAFFDKGEINQVMTDNREDCPYRFHSIQE